ncbi:MAG TPA: hypothetical protein VNZ26_14725, partial [Vicinamibacterales bacterium]|nr:hypothetical protein [Vicinamibacterales bacterium]
PPTKRAFDTFYQIIARYRAEHGPARIVSIDSSDGWWTGIAESLPFLSFFEDNTHPGPVYWSLPVLSTSVYSRYRQTLVSQARTDHPLLVEHRNGTYSPTEFPSYHVLAAAESDYGYWYLYAPDAQDSNGRPSRGQMSLLLRRDGSTESGFVERHLEPRAADEPHVVISESGWRGQVRNWLWTRKSRHISGAIPLVLIDPSMPRTLSSVDIYTSPADLAVANLDHAIEPLSEEPLWRSDMVRDFGPGRWKVDGQAKGQFVYLIEFPEKQIAGGTYLVVRGELQDGGVQVGFVEHSQWSSFVVVTRHGPFEAVLEIQKPGRYSVIIANCIAPSWWQHAWLAFTGQLTNPPPTYWANRFWVSEAGWIKAEPLARVSPD